MTAAAGLPPRAAVGRIFGGGGGAWHGRVVVAWCRWIPVVAQPTVPKEVLLPRDGAAPCSRGGDRWPVRALWPRASLLSPLAAGWCGAPSASGCWAPRWCRRPARRRWAGSPLFSPCFRVLKVNKGAGPRVLLASRLQSAGCLSPLIWLDSRVSEGSAGELHWALHA